MEKNNNLEKFWNHANQVSIKQEIEEELLDHSQENEPEWPIIEKDGITFNKTKELLNNNSVSDIYEWYALAMERRDREPLSEDAFARHFFEDGSSDETFYYGDKDKGYLLGFNSHNIFTPTHFAPKTLRGGYDLFMTLSKSQQIPAILAITDDLAETLKKIPDWHELRMNQDLLGNFRDQILKKVIYYNSYPHIEELMRELLHSYLEENNIPHANNSESL